MSANQGSHPAAEGWNLGPDWQCALDGSNCAFCRWEAPVRDLYPVEVARLRVSRWLLGANQYVHGYGLLVLDHHAIELHDLDATRRAAFIEDIADAARALASVVQPIKMNLEMLGNVIPHLHCHLKPRYASDLPAHARISQDERHRPAATEELGQMAEKLRSHLRA